MKHSWLLRGSFALGVCLVSLLTVLAAEERAAAQEGQGVYITQASARLTKLIDSSNKVGYSLQNNSFSIGGGWLKQSKTDWIALYTLNLTAGKKYRFLAAGDNDAKDVDLEVKDAKGETLAADTDTAAEAKVDFTPKTSGKYLIRIRLYDSRDSLPCVCLGVVMSKN
jgi:hypothetical protein